MLDGAVETHRQSMSLGARIGAHSGRITCWRKPSQALQEQSCGLRFLIFHGWQLIAWPTLAGFSSLNSSFCPITAQYLCLASDLNY